MSSCSEHHSISARYLFYGLGEHNALVPYAWTSLFLSVAAFILFLVPATRRNLFTLNIGCVMIYAGVYMEKGMLLILPGFTPSAGGTSSGEGR